RDRRHRRHLKDRIVVGLSLPKPSFKLGKTLSCNSLKTKTIQVVSHLADSAPFGPRQKCLPIDARMRHFKRGLIHFRILFLTGNCAACYQADAKSQMAIGKYQLAKLKRKNHRPAQADGLYDL
ncbi:MAG TPA: hypothetical protein VJ723_11490, partial [Candidatus Angelobacter sp.]|nr:hypothetical protein [Candidatus Angelobacter sp.]